jgi:hypothetical protein
MLLSRTQLCMLHRPEDADEVLAYLAIALNKPQPLRLGHSTIAKAVFGIVLIAAAVGAGAYGNVIIGHENELSAQLTEVPAVVGPKLTVQTTAIPQSPALVPAAPAVAVQAPPAPAAISLQDQIASAVIQMRASLPKKIDAVTSAIGVEHQGTMIIYKDQIAMDGARIGDLRKRELLRSIVANTCSAPGPRSLLGLGVSFRYVYFDLNSKPVITVDVTKQDCV